MGGHRPRHEQNRARHRTAEGGDAEMTGAMKMADYQELIDQYDKWRAAYERAGQPAPNEPDWEGGRLYFRIGYPYPDWRAFIVDDTNGRCELLNASIERSAVVTEG